MKGALTALLGLFVIGSASAQEPPVPCAARAAENKLAGAALKSFISKCEKDAKSACDLSATEKKLYGAARISFTAKCLSDAVRDFD